MTDHELVALKTGDEILHENLELRRVASGLVSDLMAFSIRKKYWRQGFLLFRQLAEPCIDMGSPFASCVSWVGTRYFEWAPLFHFEGQASLNLDHHGQQIQASWSAILHEIWSRICKFWHCLGRASLNLIGRFWRVFRRPLRLASVASHKGRRRAHLPAHHKGSWLQVIHKGAWLGSGVSKLMGHFICWVIVGALMFFKVFTMTNSEKTQGWLDSASKFLISSGFTIQYSVIIRPFLVTFIISYSEDITGIFGNKPRNLGLCITRFFLRLNQGIQFLQRSTNHAWAFQHHLFLEVL